MKNLVATAAALILLATTAVFAQNTAVYIPPVEGATLIGSFEMDLAIVSAPQPDMTYAASDNDRTGLESSLWLISGTNGNPDEVVIKTDGNPIMPWAAEDGVYHSASKAYMFDKVGAMVVWTADALGFDLNSVKTRVIFVETDSSDVTTKSMRKYQIKYNGNNTEVYLLGEGASS